MLILVDVLDESLDRLEMTALIHSRRTFVAALDMGAFTDSTPDGQDGAR